MVKLADTLALGASAARLGSSSLPLGTIRRATLAHCKQSELKSEERREVYPELVEGSLPLGTIELT